MLPGIIPRIRELGLHFGHFAYLVALVLNSARLIPDGHPALKAINIGRFGVRQVLAIAANNITWSKRNIDQIAIFSAIVIGIVMIAVQAALIAAYAFVDTAHAGATAGSSADSFFRTPNENKDLAFIMMSQVFGTELSMFGSGGGAIGTTDNPLHKALKGMLGLYSKATMVIAVIIVLYYILTVIAEAAQTGTPFGRRFNSVWAPIRLVVALGLLVPLGSGLNSAQYITLWTAKLGSGFGSQVWLNVANVIKDGGATRYNVPVSEPLWVHSMVENAFIASVCAKAHNDHAQSSDEGYSWNRVLLSGDTEHSFVYNWRGPDAAPHHRQSCGTVSVSFPDGQESMPINDNVFGVQSRQSPLNTANLLNTIRPIIERALDEIDEVGNEYNQADHVPSLNKLKEIADKYSKELTEAVNNVYASDVNAELSELMNGMEEKGWLYSGVWYIQMNRTMQSAYQKREKSVPSVTIPHQYTAGPGDAGFFSYESMIWNSYSVADAKIEAAKNMIRE